MPTASRFLIACAYAVIFCPSAGRAQAVDYSALEAAFGEPVTTSVTGKPQRNSQVPASTIIITRKEIARSAARDVPGLLKMSLGVDVNRWTAGQTDVAIRGGVQSYNARLLVLVDGRQVYLDHYGMTNWNLLGVQLEQIEQIELVRGAASALFGFNAASGVVNIVTRRTVEKVSATASAEGGNHGYSRIGGTISGPVASNVGVRVTAGHSREDERKIPERLLRPTSIPTIASDQISGEARGTFGRSEVVLSGGYAKNRQLEVLPIQLMSAQRYRSGNVNAQFKRDTDWGGLTFNSYINWLKTDFGKLDNAQMQFAQIRLANRTIVNQGAAVIRVATDSTLRLAAEYRNNRIRSTTQAFEIISNDVLSADGILDIGVNDMISLTLAGRVDKLWLGQKGEAAQPAISDRAAFDRSYTRASFNVALLVNTGDTGQLRLNGGLGYQLPPLAYYGIQVPIRIANVKLPIFYTGDPSFSAIPVWSIESTYGQDLAGVKIKLTGFYTRTADAIVTPTQGAKVEIRPVPYPAVLVPVRSIGSYGTYGAEFTAQRTFGNLGLVTKYTWNRTFQNIPLSPDPLPFGFSPRDATPEHKVVFKANYSRDRWSLSSLARYTSATRQFAYVVDRVTGAAKLRLLPISEAVSVDSRIGFALTSATELFVAGENLTGAEGSAGSPIPADTRVRAGVRVNF